MSALGALRAARGERAAQVVAAGGTQRQARFHLFASIARPKEQQHDRRAEREEHDVNTRDDAQHRPQADETPRPARYDNMRGHTCDKFRKAFEKAQDKYRNPYIFLDEDGLDESANLEDGEIE